VIAVLFSSSVPAAVVVARSEGVGVDAGLVLRGLLDRFGGRGGGTSDLAQGAGLVGDVRQFVAAAREALATVS
jgi:alanyl-tRNA synthetase